MANKQLRMLAVMLTAFALGSVLLAACVRPGSPTASSASSSGSSSGSSSASSGSTPTASTAASCPSGTSVTTGASSFEQTCITLSKGAMLKFIPGSGSSYHSLDYGQWNGTTPQTTTYGAAPKISSLIVQTQAVSVGPFTAAGTYHIYCVVHAGMNLMVIVK
jgi:plastocyanin